MADAFRDYVGDFCVQDNSEKGTLGSICWAPMLFHSSRVNVVRSISNDPASADFGRYTVQSVHMSAVADSRTVPSNHRFPDKNLQLSLGEDLFVVRGKVRPVIVMFNPRNAHQQVVQDGAKPVKDADVMLGCVPLYTLVDARGNSKHRPVFIENVQALKYAAYCYLPGHALLDDDRDNFARLDRLTWFPPELLRPIGVKINDPGIAYLRAWHDWLSVGKALPTALADARQFFLEMLEEARSKAAAASHQT